MPPDPQDIKMGLIYYVFLNFILFLDIFINLHYYFKISQAFLYSIMKTVIIAIINFIIIIA